MSSSEKYATLLRHYDKKHLSKLEGRIHPLSVMKRATVGETETEESLLERVKKEEFQVFPKAKSVEPAPNPHQMSKFGKSEFPDGQELLEESTKHSKMDNELAKILGGTDKAQKVLEQLAEDKKKAKDSKITLENVLPFFTSSEKAARRKKPSKEGKE